MRQLQSVIDNSAKAVIVDQERLLLIRNQDSSDMGLGTWYALPGGRQRYGETLEEALRRECREELGAAVEVGRLLLVREYIHARHRLRGTGRDQHKVEFMFACRLFSSLSDGIAVDRDQTGWEWVSFADLSAKTVFPTRLAELVEILHDTGRTVGYWGDTY